VATETGERPWWSRRPPPGLAARVGFNGLAQTAPLLVTVALTPLLLSRLGPDRFGIWSLALVVLSTLTTLDGGVSGSLSRYFAIHAARNDREDAGRLLLASVLLFVALGALLTLFAIPLAPAFVRLVHIPTTLHGEGILVFRWLPLLVALALISDATASLLQGNGQFVGLAVTMVASSAVFAVAVVVLTQPGRLLSALIIAAALRYGSAAGVGLLLAMRHVSIRQPFLPARAVVRDIGRYASRMQLTALTWFVNGELNSLVIAVALPVRNVGLYGIGMQAASAARSFPLFAFPPVLTRLTTTFRVEGRAETAAEFERLERRWLPAVLSYGVVAVAAIGFSVPVWLGRRYDVSGAVAVILLAGYVVHVGLTGMRTCYARAVGRPGLETQYAVVWTFCNAVLLVPLTLLVGVTGAAMATAISASISSLYFVKLCLRAERLGVVLLAARWWVLAAVAGTISVAGELAILRTELHGFPALILSGLPPLVSLGVIVAVSRRSAAGPTAVAT
jgi:O-antigen/teichoic acid export membrane protein